MAEVRPSVDELKALRVVDLRQRLSSLGLPQSGVKADLIDRIDKYYTSREQQQAAAAASAAGVHQMHSPAAAAAAVAMGSPQQQHAQLAHHVSPPHVAMYEQQMQQQQMLQQQPPSFQQIDPQQAQFYQPQPQVLQPQPVQQDQYQYQQEQALLMQREAMERARLEEQERERTAALLAEQERQRQEQQLQIEAAHRQQQEEAARIEAERQMQMAAAAQQQAELEAAQRLREEEEAAAKARAEAAMLAEQQQAEQLRLEQQRQQEEAMKLEAERQEALRLEEEAKRAAELEAERQRAAELEAEQQRAAELAAEQQRAAELEAQRLREAEAQRLREEEEARKAREEAEQAERMRQEAEAQRLREEAEEAQRQQEEAARIQAEQQRQEEERRQAEEAEKARLAAEAEAQKQRELEEAQRLAAEEEQRKAEEAEKAKQEEEAAAAAAAAAAKKPLLNVSLSKGAANLPQRSLPISVDEDLEADKDDHKQGVEMQPAPADLELPDALEQALAYKDERAEQLMEPSQEEPSQEASPEPEDLNGHQNEDHEEVAKVNGDAEVKQRAGAQEGGGRQNKKKKKKKKKDRPQQWARQAALEEERKKREEEGEQHQEDEVEIEYVQESLDLDLSNPMYRQFAKIFDAFKIQDGDEDKEKEEAAKLADEEAKKNEELKKVPKLLEEDDLIEPEEGDDDDKTKLSKRKLKKLNRLSVAELKQLVHRPDVVEMHDVTAKDPGLLVALKATRNTVPVPRHWCFKRKYLQGKRGIEKPPFQLPDFIRRTGITEMREALQEKESEKSLKTKMREKVRPKLGKIDIDYQKLHDAFFKWQTKPRMTHHGDLYYEGKEFEIRLKEKKPGDLSDELRTALGMPVGPNAHKVPPPWLIAMQRYGPPPSYPNLKIPGLNSAIPEGCSFGYHAGGWGKPPVDETGKPLYGDVFGTADAAYNQQVPQEEIDTGLWGEMESESEEESEEEEEEEEEEEGEGGAGEGDQAAGAQTPVVGGEPGMATPSGMSSVGGLGQETPELLELRKKKIEAEMEGGETPSLFTVLPERRTDRIGGSMMGSTHTYDVSGGGGGGGGAGQRGNTGVDVALNPEELDLMDTEAMAAKAEAALREQQAMFAGEDLSDMVAEHAARQSSKRKRQAAKDTDSKSAKKYKEFKF